MSIRIVRPKTILLFFLLAFVFVSCGKEEGFTTVEPPIDSVTYDGATVRLQAEGKYGDLRTLYTIADNGSSSLSLPEEGVNVHCLIRSSRSNRVSAVTLHWRRTGENKLEYAFTDESFNLITGADPLAEGSGDWYIMGIIGGVLNVNNGEVAFEPTVAVGVKAGSGQAAKMDIPFVFPWTKLDVVNVKGVASLRLPSSVQFKPQGILLRHHITNAMYTRWRVQNLRVVSNTMSLAGKFVPPALAVGAMPTWIPSGTSADAGHASIVERPAHMWRQVYTLAKSDGVTPTTEIFERGKPSVKDGCCWTTPIPQDNKMYYLTWAMPGAAVGSATDPFTGVFLEMVALRDKINETDPDVEVEKSIVAAHQTFFSSVRPVAGKTYRVESLIKRPTMALEYMAEYNLSGNKTFATTHDYMSAPNTSTGKYFKNYDLFGQTQTLEESQANLASNLPSVMPEGYHLPMMNEARGILGTETLVSNVARTPATAAWSQFPEPNINTFTETIDRDCYSISVYDAANKTESTTFPGGRVLYALRWSSINKVSETSTRPQDQRNTRKDLFLSAWRYEFVPNIGNTGVDQPGVVITARYLGPASTLTIADIANKAWWLAQSIPVEDEVQRILPMAGYQYEGRNHGLGKHGVMMLNTSYKAETELLRQGDLTIFRPERMGVRTNADILYYTLASPAEFGFTPDVRGIDYPAYTNAEPLRWSQLAFPIRPFKGRVTRQRITLM